MQKIGSVTDTADQNGEFTDGNVAQGVSPTILPARIFNTWQRELVNIVDAAGIELDPEDDGQILDAIRRLLAKAAAVSSVNGKVGDVEITTSDTGGVNKSGDTMTGELTGAYTGSKAFSIQYSTKASFFDEFNAGADSGYSPLIKQKTTIENKSSWAISQGSLAIDGSPRWVMQFKGSAGQEAQFSWDADGNYIVQNDIKCAGSVYVGNARIANNGDIWGTPWNPSGGWLWEAVIEQVGARASWDYVNSEINKIKDTAGVGWFRSGSSGRIIQAFNVAAAGGQTVRRANFPIPFPNGVDAVTLSWTFATSGQPDFPARITSWDNNGVSYIADGVGSISFFASGS